MHYKSKVLKVSVFIIKACCYLSTVSLVNVGSSESTGVTVSGYQYDRYCNLEEGLTKLLKSVGYRLELSYSQTLKAVVVSAVPIVDYSRQVELSSDMRTDYTMKSQQDGVNHLICLGKGELKDRTVYHWYVDANGNIDTVQHFFGADEIAEVFDYSGGELPDLIKSGRDRLESLMNDNSFGMTIDAERDIGIGDIVGGRDYLSGMTMTSPIAGKIVTSKNGSQSIEYKLEDDVSVTVEPVLVSVTTTLGVSGLPVYSCAAMLMCIHSLYPMSRTGSVDAAAMFTFVTIDDNVSR